MSSGDVYDLLFPLLDDCMAHFSGEETRTGKSFVQSLKSIHGNSIHIRPVAVEFIAKVAHKYDASPEIKANGYRSLLALLDSLMHIIVSHLQTICKEKNNIFFRANQYSDKLRALAQNLHQMRALLGYAQILIGMSGNGTLFATEQDSDDIMHDCEIMSKSCFYSHVQGFQYYAGIQPVIQALSMFTASYNDIAQHTTVWETTKSLFNSGKYVVSPSERGKKIEKIYSEADAGFFKAFFSLPEMGVGVLLPSIMGNMVRVNRVFNLPDKVFEMETLDGEVIEIKKTSMLGNGRHVKARLISAVLREGQESADSPSLPDSGLDKSKVLLRATPRPKSSSLLFFCHGGGFISLTTKSYEVVLREWSCTLDCPIFSVDYSLAPDAPFPEAFEECFYAYAWALKNSHLLGTTAERIIFAGDSAGGNLVLSIAMRAAAYGIKRPDAVLAMYPSCVVRYSASPSRLLAVMDPLLPHCMLSACLCAYTGFRTEKVAYNMDDHRFHPTDGVVNEDDPADDGNTTQLENESDLQSPSKTGSSVISTFLQDVGEGLGRLRSGTASNEPKPGNWLDDEIASHENTNTTTPTSSSMARVVAVSGLVRGFGKKLSKKMTSAFTAGSATKRSDNYWDDEFDMVSLEDSEGETESAAGTDVAPESDAPSTPGYANSDVNSKTEPHFKVKLANNFMPLKSKYFGERTKVHHTALVKNPYISPGLASDEMLSTLPYVDIVGCELDPLFDDSVTLSRRLHEIGHEHKFHVVRGQPHGFLNLQICKETKEASKMCLQLLKDRMFPKEGTSV